MSIMDDLYWSGLSGQDVPDAYAAAGVLAARGLSTEGELIDVLAQGSYDVGSLGSGLHEWVRPSKDTLHRFSAGALVDSWRSAVARVTGPGGKPTIVRLWLHTHEPDEPARLFRGATPPGGGLLALSVSKVLTRTRPVPRWTWPLVVGVDVTATRTAELLVHQPDWLRNLVRFVDLHDPLERCSLALLPADWAGTLVDRYGRARAAAAIVLGADPGRPEPAALMDEQRLGAVAAVVLTGDDDPAQMVEIVRHVSHDLTLDEAVMMAARSRVGIDYRVYGEHTFLNRTRLRRMADDRAVERAPSKLRQLKHAYWVDSAASFSDAYRHQLFSQEGGDSTDMANNLVDLERGTDRLEQRFLQGRAERQGGPDVRSRVVRLDLSVWIGPATRRRRGQVVAINESTIEWDGDQVDLKVVLIPLAGRARPQQRSLTLLRTGPSTSAHFAIRVSRGTPYRARLVVMREHRFVQTAVATVTANGSVRLEAEAVVRPLSTDLLDVVPAELAIVHNHDSAGRPLTTAIAGDLAWSVVPGKLAEILASFQTILVRVANDPEAYETPEGEAFGRLVVDLARQGRVLNEKLFTGPKGAMLPDAETEELVGTGRVAVLAAVAGDVLPLEFVYDCELSTGPGRPGRLCPNHKTAAAAGRCCSPRPGGEGDVPGPGPQVVCPFGFWGVRKEIERHVNRELAQDVLAERGEHALAPVATITDSVATLRGVLGGASAKVDLNPTEEWSKAQENLRHQLGANVRFASTWPDWLSSIESEAADLLLLLPHVGRDESRTFLEIGGDDSLELVDDLETYVLGMGGRAHARAPIVLLLGCATAAGAPLGEFPSRFLDGGARLVIGTLTAVRGRFVAPLGERLTTQILQQSSGGGVQVGELLQRIRRGAFRDGDPTAMALVAFGDSSWILRRR